MNTQLQPTQQATLRMAEKNTWFPASTYHNIQNVQFFTKKKLHISIDIDIMQKIKYDQLQWKILEETVPVEAQTSTV